MKKIIITLILTLALVPVTVNGQTVESLTRQLLQLQAILNSLQSGQSTNSASSGSICFTATASMGIGSTNAGTGGQVSLLQRFLQSRGFYNGSINGLFDQATENAVKSFQVSRNIVSSGTPDTTGFGRVGPLTRSVINANCASLSGGTSNNSNSLRSGESIDTKLEIDKDEVYPGDTINITATIENRSGLTLTGPIFECTGVLIAIDKHLDATLEGDPWCFDFEQTETIEPGQGKKYRLKLQIDKTANDGDFKMTAKFPGGYTETERFEVLEVDEELVVNVETDRDSYVPGDPIYVRAYIINNTLNDVTGSDPGECDGIRITIDGIEEGDRFCYGYTNPYNNTIRSGDSQTFSGTFQLPIDVAPGEYDMTIELLTGIEEELEITIE